MFHFFNSNLKLCLDGELLQDVKTPSGNTIAEMKSFLETDHEEKSGAGWASGLKIDPEMLQGLEDGLFSKSSAPSRDQALAEELAKAEEQKKKEIAAAKRASKPPKPFESESVWASLQPELLEWGKKLALRGAEMITKAEALLDELNKDTEFLTSYALLIKTLSNRLALLVNAHYIVEGQVKKEASTDAKDRHRAQFDRCINEEAIAGAGTGLKKVFNDSKTVEPYSKMYEMKVLSEIYYSLGNVKLEKQDDVKSEKVRLREMTAIYNALISRVSDNVSKLRHSFQKKVDLRAASHDKKVQEEADAKKKELAKAQAKAKAQPKKGPSERTHVIHSLVLPDHMPNEHKLIAIDVAALAWMAWPLTSPVLVGSVGWLLPGPLVSALTAFLDTDFPQSNNYTGSCRGAKLLDQEVAAVKAKGNEMWRGGSEILRKVTPAEKAHLSAPWMFAYSGAMRACAPEFSFLGSAKYTMKGERSVVTCSYKELTNYARKIWDIEHTTTAHMPLQFVCDQLSEIKDRDHLAALMAEVPSVKFGRCEADSLFLVPWGTVVAEASSNQNETVGIRWIGVHDTCNDDVVTLCEDLLPPDGKVKNGTAISFLYKMVPLAGGADRPGNSPAMAVQLKASAGIKTEQSAKKRSAADAAAGAGAKAKAAKLEKQ